MRIKTKITVVGSGYVGMSLAVLLAQHNDVVILDVDPVRVNKVNNKQSTIADTEIESFLSTHPAVKMPQVIGVPDDRLLEVACAYIELNEGMNATAEEIIEFCQGKIAGFKIPRYVRFVTDWPMSTTKIQKYVLRDWFLSGD